MQELLEALPRIKGRAAGPPERILTAKQRRLWLDGFDRSRVIGRRDYTMALCLSDLGMRVGDLAKLRLDDLDWRKSAIRIPNSKQKRPYWLPLPSRCCPAVSRHMREACWSTAGVLLPYEKVGVGLSTTGSEGRFGDTVSCLEPDIASRRMA